MIIKCKVDAMSRRERSINRKKAKEEESEDRGLRGERGESRWLTDPALMPRLAHIAPRD
jgi:hypothetical protein